MARPEAVSLVGMPAAGKSTVGVLLAKATGLGFVDTDVRLQVRAGRTLAALLAEAGLEAFLAAEAATVLALDPRGHVVATGGSVVYSEAAMRHLAAAGPIVLLDLPLEALARRIGDLAWRGVVMESGQTLAQLYGARMPRYRRWADVAVACGDRTPDEVVAAILAKLGG